MLPSVVSFCTHAITLFSWSPVSCSRFLHQKLLPTPTFYITQRHNLFGFSHISLDRYICSEDKNSVSSRSSIFKSFFSAKFPWFYIFFVSYPIWEPDSLPAQGKMHVSTSRCFASVWVGAYSALWCTVQIRPFWDSWNIALKSATCTRERSAVPWTPVNYRVKISLPQLFLWDRLALFENQLWS